MIKQRILWIVMAALFIGATPLIAVEDKKPTVITSDGPLNADFEKKIAIFKDNVLVKDDQGTINSDKMKVFFAGESNQIERVECYGNVKIKHDKRYSESDEAIYYALENKIILTGDPLIKQGSDQYRAEKITIFTVQNRVIFEPSAQLVIFPGEEMDSKLNILGE